MFAEFLRLDRTGVGMMAENAEGEGSVLGFADQLVRHRLAAGFTQERLSELAGVSAYTISNLEREVASAPHRDTVRRLADALSLAGDERAQFLASVHTHGRRRRRGAAQVSNPLGTDSGIADPGRRPPIPHPLDRLIGREMEVAAIGEALLRTDVRLLTLVGAPGVGKTRLALATAEAVEGHFADGATFVSLAPLRDPGQVPSALAAVLDVREQPQQSLLDALHASLREKHLLLLLDNFEHLVAVSATVVDLLAACPNMKALVTSRVQLHLRGEQLYEVAPLALPPEGAPLSIEALAELPAIALFVDRARAVQPDFALDSSNSAAIIAICRRLDGLPLTLELAAARLRLFSPQELLARLEAHRLPVLTGGPKDLQTHQQTLRSTLDWSYALLASNEQALLRRLAIFAGGATLEAIVEVCDLDAVGESILLDGLSVLVDHSLANREAMPAGHSTWHESGDGAGDKEGVSRRMQMLETIREYAWDLLTTSNEMALLQQAHARYFQVLVARAEAHWRGPDQPRWLARLEQELENLRAAFRWAIQFRDALVGLQLTGPLWHFWVDTGRYSEGRAWLEQMLALSEESPAAAREMGDGTDGSYGNEDALAPRELPTLRATAFNGAGALATLMGDYEAALVHHERALALRRTMGNAKDIASSLNNLGGLAMEQGDYPRARALWEESLAFRRQTGEVRLIAVALMNLGVLAYFEGDYRRARAALEDCLPRFREVGDPVMLARTLNSLGSAAIGCGDLDQAGRMVDESLSIAQSLGHQRDIAFALYNVARIARLQGDHQQAVACCQDAQRIHEQLGDRSLLAQILALRGAVALDVAGYAETEQLLAQSLQMREALHYTQGCADVLAELGHLARERGQWRQALERYREALQRYREVESTANVATCLEGCASVLLHQGQASFAVRLLGAAAALRAAGPSLRVPREQAAYEQTMHQVREHLEAEAIAMSWQTEASAPLADMLADMIAGITQLGMPEQ